jgi:hypothetical protein
MNAVSLQQTPEWQRRQMRYPKAGSAMMTTSKAQ